MHRLLGWYVLRCSSAWWSLTIWIRALPRGCLMPPATVSMPWHCRGLGELKKPPRSTGLLTFCFAGNIICVWKGVFFKWKRHILKSPKTHRRLFHTGSWTPHCLIWKKKHAYKIMFRNIVYFLLQSWYFSQIGKKKKKKIKTELVSSTVCG